MIAVRLTKAEFRDAEARARVNVFSQLRKGYKVGRAVRALAGFVSFPPGEFLSFDITPNGWECLTPVQFVDEAAE